MTKKFESAAPPAIETPVPVPETVRQGGSTVEPAPEALNKNAIAEADDLPGDSRGLEKK